MIFRGEPNTLFTKLEKPVFFLNAMATFAALLPSEYRFELIVPFSPGGAARVGEVSIIEPPKAKVAV